MEVRRHSTAERYEPDPGWRRVSLADEDAMSVEWFRKPPGHSSPMHDHPPAQVCVVLAGELTVQTDTDTARLGVFDAAYLAGDERHGVENSGSEPAIGLDIFVPGRTFDFWTEG